MAISLDLLVSGTGLAGAEVATLLLVRARRDFRFGKYCMVFYRDAVDFRDTLFSVGSCAGFVFVHPLHRHIRRVGELRKKSAATSKFFGALKLNRPGCRIINYGRKGAAEWEIRKRSPLVPVGR